MEQQIVPEPSEIISDAQDIKKTPDIHNPLVNNVLDYLNERLTPEDGEE